MTLKYVHGKWLHDQAVKHKDPVAILVKRFWSAERSPSYGPMRRTVVGIIGRRRWNLLHATRSLVGKEMFYRAIYDAILAKMQGRLSLPSLPPVQLPQLGTGY